MHKNRKKYCMESILFDISWCYLEIFYLFTNNFKVDIKLEKH